MRIGFTQHFKSPAVREVLEREILQKRLLLCLYGMGTNTGLKRISQGVYEFVVGNQVSTADRDSQNAS